METRKQKDGGEIYVRLNRTMQYGNLYISYCVMFRFILFKSYYVVWKHKKDTERDTDAKVFKSYYVVWKLLTRNRT